MINGRSYDFYYSGPKLHMIVLREDGATYWVVNTLLDSLSNETMIADRQGAPAARSSQEGKEEEEEAEASA